MPYVMRKNDKGEFCIFNKDTGDNKGCSKTKKMATEHMRAMYAAEGGAKMGKKDLEELVTKAIEESEAEHLKMYGEPMMEYVPFGITTFTELDEYRASQEAADEINSATHDLMSLVGNVMGNYDVKDKVSSIKALADEYGSRISGDLTEIKGLEDEHGEIPNATQEEKDVKSDKPLPEKKKDLFEKAHELWNALWDRLFAEEKEVNLEGTSMLVFKDKSGNYRWLARYSNNIRDDDNPREIISSTSHRRFVERVDKGLAPYPDLQIWHEKEWTMGKADWVAYDDAGFALASGTFSPSLGEDTIKSIASLKNWRMSHGMPKTTIKRDEGDPTIITEHETREITYLPAMVAANKRTDFTIFEQKEEDMIPTDKKKVMQDWGLAEDQITAIENLNLFDADKAKQEGVESKDKTEQKDEPQAEGTPPVESTPVAETPPVEGASQAESTPAVDFAAVIHNELAPLIERVTALEGEIKAVKEANEQAIKTLNDSPAASLGTILSNIRSAVGADETRVDGRTSLAKDKPKETPSENVEGRTLVPFVNKLIAGS